MGGKEKTSAVEQEKHRKSLDADLTLHRAHVLACFPNPHIVSKSGTQTTASEPLGYVIRSANPGPQPLP